MAEKDLPPPECANCGAAIPRHARACPDCGADERTGWRESSIYDGLDLPDQAWREDDAPDYRTNRAKPATVNGVAWYWWIVGVLLLLTLVGGFLGLRG